MPHMPGIIQSSSWAGPAPRGKEAVKIQHQQLKPLDVRRRRQQHAGQNPPKVLVENPRTGRRNETATSSRQVPNRRRGQEGGRQKLLSDLRLINYDNNAFLPSPSPVTVADRRPPLSALFESERRREPPLIQANVNMSEPDVSVSGGDFFGRIPYASLIALLLCWLGAILFCVMAHQAIKTTVDQVRVPLGLADAVYYLERIQISFVVLALAMLVVAGALIVFSFLATGTTRSRVYSGWRAKMGGRLAAVLCIMLAYVANLFWTFMLAIAAIFSFVYIIFEKLCAATRENYDEDNCFDFTLFKPLFRTDNQLLLCGGEVEKFCALTSTASLWYYVAFFGALLVSLGLIHFIACLAANYVHIERGSKYEELNQIWNSEMAEMAPEMPPFHRRESPGRLGYRNVPDDPRMVTSSYKY